MADKEETYTGLAPEIDEEDVLKSLDALEDLVKGDAKEEKEEKEESDKDQDDEGEPDEDEDDEDAEKSFGSDFEETEEIQKAVEVSAFLADLVDSVRASIDDLRKAVTVEIGEMKKSLTDMRGFQATAIDRLAKAMSGETEKVTGLVTGMEDLRKSLEDFGNSPARPRKSTLKVIEKSFNQEGDGEPVLRKSQIVDRLVRLAQQRDSGVSLLDVTKFEMSGELRPELMDRIRNQ
jgi:molecular chaperone GrpE (heat shock protein)